MYEPEPPTGDRGWRPAVLYCLLVVAVLGVLVGGGWYYLERRTNQRDTEVAGRLNQKLAVQHQALSDAECEQLLALSDSPEAEVRLLAINLTAASAKGWGGHPPRPELAARVVPVAVRLLADPDARVRTHAVNALRGLRAKEHIEAIRPLLQAADPRERQAAEEAIAALTASEPAK
jgi:hypothetical protein